MNNDTIIDQGRVIVVTTPSSFADPDEFHILGVFRVLKPFSPVQKKGEFIQNGNIDDIQHFGIEPDKFLNTLIADGYLEVVISDNLHISDDGNAESIHYYRDIYRSNHE